MQKIDLVYDFFVVAIIFGSGYYLKSHTRGKFDRTGKQKIDRVKGIKNKAVLSISVLLCYLYAAVYFC